MAASRVNLRGLSWEMTAVATKRLPRRESSPSRHLAQAERADGVERPLPGNVQRFLECACRNQRPRQHKFDQVGQFRAGAAAAQNALHLALGE
jgi:hypothetical protein